MILDIELTGGFVELIKIFLHYLKHFILFKTGQYGAVIVGVTGHLLFIDLKWLTTRHMQKFFSKEIV